MNWKKRGNESSVEEVFLRNHYASSKDQFNGWFKKAYENDFNVDGTERAAQMILGYKNKPVVIVGDYDGDGVTATSIMLTTLKVLGFSNVDYIIPDRINDGFGINSRIVNLIPSGSLVITVDNGVAQVNAIKEAKIKGCSVIVIDHHEPLMVDGVKVLPDADLIIDPHAIENSADYDGYCGAGLAYKVCIALIDASNLTDTAFLKRKLLVFAGIGTITDVMDVCQENAVLVTNALKFMTDPRISTNGIRALLSVFNIITPTTTDIGFKIGPALNALSRMKGDAAKEAVELLTFEGPYKEAVALAENAKAVNEARKTATKEAFEASKTALEGTEIKAPLVVYVPGVNEGVAGLIAAKLVEEYSVPSIFLTDAHEPGLIKGSARSMEGYDIKQELDKVSDHIVVYGGHAGAAGLTLKVEDLPFFVSELQSNAEEYVFKAPDLDFYDLEISIEDVPKTLSELHNFDKIGKGTDQIVFKVTGFIPEEVSIIGKNSNTLKLKNPIADAIMFHADAETIDNLKTLSETTLFETLYGTLSDNKYGGNITHQIVFKDFEK